MHVFHQINDNLPFNELEGYGAIEFTRKSNPNLICLANVMNGSLSIWHLGSKEAPLGIIWSSDEKHIEKALIWAGIEESFPYKIEEGTIYWVHRGRYTLSYDTERKMKFGSFSRISTPSSYIGHFPKRWDETTTEYEDTMYSGFMNPNSQYRSRTQMSETNRLIALPPFPEIYNTDPHLTEADTQDIRNLLLEYAQDKDSIILQPERDKQLQEKIEKIIESQKQSSTAIILGKK